MGEDTLCFGGLTLDCRRRLVFMDGEQMSFTPREFQLLSYLAHHPDSVIPRTQLLGSVWELSYGGDIRTVDTHVKCLRHKLGEFGRKHPPHRHRAEDRLPLRFRHITKKTEIHRQKPQVDRLWPILSLSWFSRRGRTSFW